MRSPLSLVLPFAFLLAIPSAHAQQNTGPGSLVRISSLELPVGRTTGVLERVTDDSIVVSGHAISRSSIRQFDVSAGRKSHLATGMGIGFVAGAGVGALTCSAVCGGGESDIKAIFTAIGAGAGGALGLGIGAALGAKKTEQWRTSSLSTLRVTPIARFNGSLGVAVGLQF